MIWFVGAGPGAVDLITVRGRKLLEKADVIVYAGSLVNKELLECRKETCSVFDSSRLTLDQVVEIMCRSAGENKDVVRLHTGDPCLYGAIREQMDALDKAGVSYEYVPGVSSFCGAAAALNMEYTLPGISQSVIITRESGRTVTPPNESIKSFAEHQTTMVLFLSTGLVEKVQLDLLAGGYAPSTPVAVVYKATWPEEKTFYTTVENLAALVKEQNLTNTCLFIVGKTVEQSAYLKSKLYDPEFSTGFRKGNR